LIATKRKMQSSSNEKNESDCNHPPPNVRCVTIPPKQRHPTGDAREDEPSVEDALTEESENTSLSQREGHSAPAEWRTRVQESGDEGRVRKAIRTRCMYMYWRPSPTPKWIRLFSRALTLGIHTP
jgi:hypothetical protein